MDGVFFLYDCTRRETFENLKEWHAIVQVNSDVKYSCESTRLEFTAREMGNGNGKRNAECN